MPFPIEFFKIRLNIENFLSVFEDSILSENLEFLQSILLDGELLEYFFDRILVEKTRVFRAMLSFVFSDA